jgi:hypothetical protein
LVSALSAAGLSPAASVAALAEEVRRLGAAFLTSVPASAAGFSVFAAAFVAGFSEVFGVSVALADSEASALVTRRERRTGLSCWISSMLVITHFFAAICRYLET